MQKKTQTSRRDFLKTSGALAAGATLVSGLSVGRSAYAAGNDQIKLALVGCGGRGSGAIRQRLDVGDNVKLVAVADAFEDNAKRQADALRKDGEEKYQGKIDLPPERVFGSFDGYKKAIDCLSPGDQVLIATTPGFRPLHYRYAVEKGVHVFMEKPLCVDAAGFRSLIESNKIADEKNLKVTVGLQRRYDQGFQNWIGKIHEGLIGDISFTRVYWNGGLIWCRHRDPGESEMSFQMKNWYHFVWLCGDNITEQHVHNLDMGLWMHSKGDVMCHPVEANAMGGRQNQACPESLRRTAPPFADRAAWDEWYQKNKGQCNRHGQAWDHFFVEFTFADGSKMFSQCRHIGNSFNAVNQFVHGTQGSGGSEAGGKGWLNDPSGKNLFTTGVNAGQFAYEHVVHAKNIRENIKRNDGWYGAHSTMTAVLGRYAAFSGKVVKWDEAVEKGKTDMPPEGVWDWNANPPVMPDADGFYEGSVAKQGIYNPFA
ncbi:MAG: Gfo/Idh/MocA family oxidoreductase [Planctomycetaceae bacterium]|jgi:predicted dehydrogenase|nr:Gfo/Idh/MocA family oxidoreductase [Planctomycetaceae bacterium]